MKLKTWVVCAAILGFCGPALAGQVGAGPGGTGSLIVGATVTVDSLSRAVNGSPKPGMVGAVTLTPEQVASLTVSLQAQQGTTVTGNIISAPTVFADGTNGRIDLDTSTGRLTLTRV